MRQPKLDDDLPDVKEAVRKISSILSAPQVALLEQRRADTLADARRRGLDPLGAEYQTTCMMAVATVVGVLGEQAVMATLVRRARTDPQAAAIVSMVLWSCLIEVDPVEVGDLPGAKRPWWRRLFGGRS